MSDYGAGPASNQVEFTLFGPGYGEAIAVHLGDGCWILVDSCIHPNNKQPASLHYLQQIGVQAAGVKIIVASHWHDDHVRGLSKLAGAFPSAKFILSGVFNNKEALTFLCAYGSIIAKAQTRGTKELFEFVSKAGEEEKLEFAYGGKILFEETVQARKMTVIAFSPTTKAQAKSLSRMATFIPKAEGLPITHVPELEPNLEAVVLHIDFGDDALLLGSDLEDHGDLGWAEILNDNICTGRRKATSYKVAHHGSKTGHAAGIWLTLLTALPIASLTPFNRGSSHLPTDKDKQRIKETVSAAYLTSGASKKPAIPNEQLKRMLAIGKNIVKVNSGFGAVRFRKELGAPAWDVELFGDALKI